MSLKFEIFVEINKKDTFEKLGKSVHNFLSKESEKMIEEIDNKKDQISMLRKKSDERLQQIQGIILRNENRIKNFSNFKKKLLSQY